MAAQTLVLNMDRCVGEGPGMSSSSTELRHLLPRCTKNFYVYLCPETKEWCVSLSGWDKKRLFALSSLICRDPHPSAPRYRLPWDLDAAFGQDNGYGGKSGIPGESYCVLACEQVGACWGGGERPLLPLATEDLDYRVSPPPPWL